MIPPDTSQSSTILSRRGMITRLRLFLTMLFAAGYLCQSLVLGVIHLHMSDGSRCDGQISGCAAVETQAPSHRSCHGSHNQCPSDNGQCPSDDRSDGGSGRRPAHDHENCSICHHLVEKTLSAEAVCPPRTGEAVEPIETALPIFYPAPLPRTQFSRGPPAQSC
jgi:hypothetical protein